MTKAYIICTHVIQKDLYKFVSNAIMAFVGNLSPTPATDFGCVYHLSQVGNTFQYPLSKRVKKTKERRF